MRNKNRFFDRFFHFVAAIVDLYAFVLICNSIIDGTNIGMEEWSSIIIAIIVTVFMLIYRRIKNNSDQNDNDEPPRKQVNIMVYNQFNNCDCSKQEAGIIVNKLVI